MSSTVIALIAVVRPGHTGALIHTDLPKVHLALTALQDNLWPFLLGTVNPEAWCCWFAHYLWSDVQVGPPLHPTMPPAQLIGGVCPLLQRPEALTGDFST